MNIKSILKNKTFKIYRNFLTSVPFRVLGKDFSTVLVDGVELPLENYKNFPEIY
jgi:hypothetical protein